MKIKSIIIYGFGTIYNAEYKFTSDISGVDSEELPQIAEFLRAMLYGISGRGKNSVRTRFYPAKNTDEKGKRIRFGGELLFEVGGKTYFERCEWGTTPDKDFREFNDYDLARGIRLDAGKTVGEYALRISEAAFVSAVWGGGFPEWEVIDGKIRLGKISALLGVNDGKPTAREVRENLRARLARLENPGKKHGELDSLIITQLKMRSELTRIGESDGKITKLENTLKDLKDKKKKLDEKTESEERVYLLASGARLLITKDKMNSVYQGLLASLKQLDFLAAEEKMLRAELPIRRLIPGLITIIIGALFLVASFLFKDSGSFFWVLLAVSGIVFLAGAVFCAFSLKGYRNRFITTFGGKETTYEKEIERLRQDIDSKTTELLDILGETGFGEMTEKWYRAEELLRTADDEERREAVLKSSEISPEHIKSLKEEASQTEKLICECENRLNEITEATGKSYSAAAKALDGIETKIEALSGEATALKIAIEFADASEKELNEKHIPQLVGSAEAIYKGFTGSCCRFFTDGDYNIYCSDNCEPVSAYVALRAAISKMLSCENDSQVLIMPHAGIDKNRLESLINNSSVCQIIVGRG